MEKSEVNNKWKPIQYIEINEVVEAMKQQHYAVQYIAIANKFIQNDKNIKNKENMRWDAENELFISNKFESKESFYIALEAQSLSLCIMKDRKSIVDKYSLHSKTFNEGLKWLEEQLVFWGIEKGPLKKELPSTLPTHGILEGGLFSNNNQDALEETVAYRSNADIIMKYFGCNYKIATAPRIWPSHFATSSTIPLRFGNGREAIRSLHLGFSNKDSIMHSPYFYVHYWDKDGKSFDGDLPRLSIGEWNPGKWQGSVLDAENILIIRDAQLQATSVLNFFETSIKTLSK